MYLVDVTSKLTSLLLIKRTSNNKILYAGSVRARGCVEVQAEVAQHRLSLCSEETIASDKSGNTAGSGNTADDGAASTRALAGSVLNYKVSPLFFYPPSLGCLCKMFIFKETFFNKEMDKK